MSNANIAISYLVSYILYYNGITLVQSEKLEAKATWSQCMPQAAFINCDTSRDHPKVLYNTLEYSLEIWIKKGCETSDIYNYWTLADANSGAILNQYLNRKKKATVLISKYQLGIGNYVLEAHIRESPMLDVDVWIEKKCYLRVTSSCPHPVILGGAYRTVASGSEVILSASGTHTCSLKVKYTWSCYTKTSASQTVLSYGCNNINGREEETLVLRVDARVGYTYHITLTAKSPSLPVHSATQVIKIAPRETPLVSASCMKNCEPVGLPYPDPLVPVIHKALCYKQCYLVRKYEWKLRALTSTTHPVETIMQHATYIGNNREYFIIQPNWLGYDEAFELSLHSHGSDANPIAETRVYINMTANLGGRSNCTATNNKKVGLKRIYTINCVVPRGKLPAKYRIQQMIYSPLSNDLLPRVLIYADEPVFKLRLGSSGSKTTQTLIFSVVDDSLVITNTSFKVEVPPLYDPSSPTDQVILGMKHTYLGQGVTESVRDLFHSGRIAKASQIMNVLLCLAAKLNMSDPSIATLRISAQNMLLLDIASTKNYLLSDLDYLLALVPQLVVRKSKFLYHSKLRSRFCLTIAESMLRVFRTTWYPLMFQRHMEVDAPLLHRCANYYLDDDYMKPYVFNIPLPGPISEQRVSIEDYPNYGETVDDTLAEDRKEIIKNSIAVINNVNEIFARTLVFGQEKIYNNYTSNGTIEITYSHVKNRPPCDDGDVQIALPDSLGLKPKDTVKIIYTYLPMNAYSWDPEVANMSIKTINLKVYGPKDDEIVSFPKNIHVYFKLNENQLLKKRNTSLGIPLEDGEWTEDFVQRHMKLFRVEVHKDHTLVTILSDISNVGELMVAITNNRKPTRKDFIIHVKRDSETRYLYNQSHEESWFYVAFLPSEDEMSKMFQQRSSPESDYGIEFRDDYTVLLNKYTPEIINMTFMYGFTSVACKEWTGNDWTIKHCSVGSNITPEKMHCVCSRAAVLASDVTDVDFREEEALIIPYELTLIINPILPLATVIIVAVYCILISIVHRRKKKFDIYFLSDNLEEDRYAYLLVVHTGAFNDCSTTSNVVVKLFGSKAQSRPNVLNYPDPDLRILQDGGEDWFVLTTNLHLGDIRCLQVWYDAIGPKYTWYCEYIKIFDLQSGCSWFFNTSQRFTVAKRNLHEFNFYPSEEKLWRPKRKLYTYLRFYWNADSTWIFWKRGSESVLSYMDKLTIGFYEVIFTIAVVLATLGQPTMKLKDGLGFDRHHSLEFVLYNTIIGALVTFIVFFPYSIILRYTPKRQSIFKQDRFPYSHYTSRICWILLMLIFVTSITYIIYMGFWVSYFTSILILIVSAFSITLNITLFESIKVIVFKALRRILPRKKTYTINVKAIVTEAERQRRYIYKKFGQYGLRPYLTHLYRPLTDEKRLAISKQKYIEHKIGLSTRYMAFFYLYTFLLFFLLIIKLSALTYYNSEHIMTLALEGTDRLKMQADGVESLEDLYDYLNETLAPTIHPMSWYGNWNVSEPGLLADFNTEIIGVVRIRQKRVKQYKCPLRSLTKLTNTTICHPEYSSSHADRSDRGVSKSMWSFQDIEASNVHIGSFATYGGAGFILKLGRNLNNTYYMIQLMKANDWLDERTRAVFVEFWTYSVNQNLFSAVAILFEKSATQCMMVSHQIVTLKLMHLTYSVELLSTALFVAFCIFIFRLILKYIRKVIKEQFSILLKISNLWEIAIIITNITIVVLYIKQHHEHYKVFEQFCDNKRNEFISYFTVMKAYSRIQTATALLFALAITRSMTFMKFMKHFRIFSKMLQFSYKSFLSVMVYTCLMAIAFSMSGHLMFGGWSGTFNDIEKAFVALLKSSVGLPSEFSGKTKQDYNKHVGYAFYFLFSFSVLLTLNIYTATTLLYYHKSNLHLSEIEYPYTLGQYFHDKWKFYSELWKRRLKAGGPHKKLILLVTPKEDSFRYADCVFMPDLKMQYMKYIAVSVIKKSYFKQTEPPAGAGPDFELMRCLAISCIWDRNTAKSARSIFFISKFGNKRKFVSNHKLMQMEYWLNNILLPLKKGRCISLKDTTSLNRLEQLDGLITTASTLLGNITVKTVKRKRHH